MTKRVDEQLAYVLHSRPFRNTSALIDFFTRDYGCVTAVAKGIKRSRSRYQGLLQPFNLLKVSWGGKAELVTLYHAEAAEVPYFYTGKHLVSALYLNELLLQVLKKHDVGLDLFSVYQQTLNQIKQSGSLSAALRVFEKALLTSTGYGLPLNEDAENGELIAPDASYRYEIEKGFIKVERETAKEEWCFYGQTLIDLKAENFSSALSLKESKKLLRIALSPLVNHHQLNAHSLLYTQ